MSSYWDKLPRDERIGLLRQWIGRIEAGARAPGVSADYREKELARAAELRRDLRIEEHTPTAPEAR